MAFQLHVISEIFTLGSVRPNSHFSVRFEVRLYKNLCRFDHDDKYDLHFTAQAGLSSTVPTAAACVRLEKLLRRSTREEEGFQVERYLGRPCRHLKLSETLPWIDGDGISCR